ncbi:fibronectin type III domain-containing protein, partial [Paenibacillus sepulcri]|nr:fibronectin type III domain-containing protein [Paenibacillus sepulcri]
MKTAAIAALLLSFLPQARLHAAEAVKTEIAMTVDKTSVQSGDTFIVTVYAGQAVNLFGLQYTVEYNADLAEMSMDDIRYYGAFTYMQNDYAEPSGRKSFPLINEEPADGLVAYQPIADIPFKALGEGDVVLKLSGIKAVNRHSPPQEIQGHTTTQPVTVSIEAADSPVDSIPPSAPEIRLAAKTSSTVQLEWEPAADNVGVAGYLVFQDGLLYRTLPGTAAAAEITELSPSTAYSFTVKAKDAAGN